MPHRDPQTGQFTADQHSKWDDIEVVSFGANLGVQASNLGGGTGFNGGTNDAVEGVQLIDYDEIVDRNEELRLLSAAHVLSVYANSTETEDGTVVGSFEISADPSESRVTDVQTRPRGGQSQPPDNVVGTSADDDSIDLVGRVLTATAHAPFSDSSSGSGGGGSAGEDRYESAMWPAEYGRFHPRDELFCNGRLVTWNIDDSGVHAVISGQHVYGVMEDC